MDEAKLEEEVTKGTVTIPEEIASLPEAPASMTIRFYIDGFSILFTLRDLTGKSLLEKFPPVFQAIKKLGGKPYYKDEDEGDSRSNGGNEAVKICSLHQVPMKHWSKDGRSWWSHKYFTPDGKEEWCKGAKGDEE